MPLERWIPSGQEPINSTVRDQGLNSTSSTTKTDGLENPTEEQDTQESPGKHSSRDICSFLGIDHAAEEKREFDREDSNDNRAEMSGNPIPSKHHKTAQPLYGLCPPDTIKGDDVCILFGCSVPVILRPSQLPTGEIKYKLVGEAYIHGKMNGEAVYDLEEKDVNSAEVFWIR